MPNAQSEAWSGPGYTEYGTVGSTPHNRPMDEAEGGLFLPGKRRRLNVWGILISFVMPPLLFLYEIAILRSEFRYRNPQDAVLCALLGLLVVWALSVIWNNHRTEDREPMWLGFNVVSTFLALVAGAGAGIWLYNKYMLPYYDLMSLNEYPDIDVDTTHGDAILDAGFLGFSEGSVLNKDMTALYFHGEEYCVAPIINDKVNNGVPSTGTYDFWAVGKNCCSDPKGVFRCGEYRNPSAQSGLRIVNTADREGYELAVQQAVAKYNIKATYPVFVKWCQNPLKFALELKQEGEVTYWIVISTAFVFNAFLLIVALLFFSRIGRF